MILWGLVVAAGEGARFGYRKQLARFSDRRVLDWSVDVLRPHCAGIVGVVPGDLVVGDKPAGALAEEPLVDVELVAGGPNRSSSVRFGLEAVPMEATHVLVHDAARPLADAALVQRVIAALTEGSQAVVPVVPVADSLRRLDGEAVNRDHYVAVQTPQGFDAAHLRAAHAQELEASDDATLVERSGVRVHQVIGDPRNIKLTNQHDLAIAELLATGSSSQPGQVGG